MIFQYFILILISHIINCPGTNGKLPDNENFLDTLDTDLYESVLDPELCREQLRYVVRDPSLLLKFLDSGLRIPRGLPQGNVRDFGNFPQCLSINKVLEDMTIQGKFCKIWVPININYNMQKSLPNNTTPIRSNFDPTKLHIDEERLHLLEHINKEKLKAMARSGATLRPNSLGPDDYYYTIGYELALCIPQACTTRDAIDSLFIDITQLGFEYYDMFCRLPNDKLTVTADYIAWTVVILLGVCTILSTGYDVRHTVFLKRDPKEASTLLTAFSAYRNTRDLVNISSRPGSLDCLDGVRTLSIFWVIIGHSFMIPSYYPANPEDIHEWYISYKGIFLKTANLAVDTFFLLSGLLVVYTTANKLTTVQLAKNLHLFYLNRLLRMFPILATVVLFKASFYNHMNDGAVWTLVAADAQACRAYWWVTLLHLQNFLTPDNGCVQEAWYLGIDVHLHILSPLVLFWVLSRSKRLGWIAVMAGFLISITIATAYIFANDFHSPDGLDVYIKYYINILTRSPPFFVGMIYGYALHVWRKEPCPMSKVKGYFATALSIGLIALVLYAEHINIHGYIENLILYDFFWTYIRSFWVVGVGWIIFACINGYAAPLNWFLSLSIWKIPARISYAMYLIHMTLMFIHYSASQDVIYFSFGAYMFDFFAFLYLTIFISFFLTVLIDAPFATLFKLLLERGKKKVKIEDK